MSAALDARGMKRICTGCGTRFYDMKKRPIICPGCKVEFTGEIKVKTRRGRAAAVVEDKVNDKAAANDTTEEIETDADTVSLEDVKDMEDGDADDEDMDLPDGDLGDLEEIEEDEDLEEDIDIKNEKDE